WFLTWQTLPAGKYKGAAALTPKRARQNRLPALRPLGLRELQLPAAGRNANAISRGERALQDLLGERILDLLLDGPLERARTIHRIESGLADQVARGVIQDQVHVALDEALAQVQELDVHDGPDLGAAQRMEHDDVVDPVDELRAEALLDYLHDRSLHAGI